MDFIFYFRQLNCFGFVVDLFWFPSIGLSWICCSIMWREVCLKNKNKNLEEKNKEQKNESDTFVKQFFFIFSPSFTLKTYYKVIKKKKTYYKKTHTRFEQLFQKHFFPFWRYISKRMNKTSPSFPEISKPSNIWFVLFNSQTIMV